jgi:phosphate uptake regulator
MGYVKTIDNFINEGKSKDTIAELNEMTLGQLERISDYANMIKNRMLKGQQPESWMYSQLTIALENLNSVHDAMDGIDGVDEINIIK